MRASPRARSCSSPGGCGEACRRAALLAISSFRVHAPKGSGMAWRWLGTIMLFNVWALIFNQQKILG
jgi:hypothetical protein